MDPQRAVQGQSPRSTITLQFQADHILPSREEVWFQAKRIYSDLAVDSVRTAAQHKKMHINYRTAAEAAKVRWRRSGLRVSVSMGFFCLSTS